MTKEIQAVIGQLLLKKTISDQKELVRLLDPTFFDGNEKMQIQKIIQLHHENKLISKQLLELIGIGMDVLVLGLANASYYGDIQNLTDSIIGLYQDKTQNKIKNLSYSETLEVLKDSQNRINKIKVQEIITLDEVYTQSVAEQANNPRDLSNLPKTGFQEMDSIFQGFMAGQLITVGGYSGAGKSTFIFSLIRNLARHQKTLLVSLEMDNQIVYSRLLAGMSGVAFEMVVCMNNPKTLEQLATYGKLDQLVKAQTDLHSYNLKLTDNQFDLSGIITAIRKEKTQNGLNIVFIDYLQLIKATDTSQPMRLQIAEITRELKLLAKELQITIIALAQLGRSSLDRDTPQIRDLKESGNIESDSDVIFLLYRDKKNQTCLRLAKDRMFGKAGLAELTYDFKTQIYT